MAGLEKIEYFDDRYTKARAALGGSLPSAEQISDIFERWFTALNTHDTDTLLTLVTDDIVVEDPSMMGRNSRGHDDFRLFSEITYTAFPDMRFEATTAPLIALDGNRIVVPWRGTATFTGYIDRWPPENPAPRVDGTGKQWTLEGTDTYEFRGGLISWWRISFDFFDMSQQVGLLPGGDA
ncbi:nuclear transport factor 2 family protein [Nocardia puris]|uniref:SnoaL-like protein n=1 Tax=Nocardia puris TaxID=208602 RepID=A0A366DDV7_9NOCA|nr:nuclear transport factor 2 family protein [Nocardia puris]MBF6214991.1 nuclear transport factor 2 family protein [Nocardia puris]MBF6367242.1 nuclear transport factor 2 family protein [Nocardia puris]MBF6461781.1 nuclear transport factor 2 family protein [Nocardia puris]RBO88237.1 SnoaL-like protein [Nocardia puris]